MRKFKPSISIILACLVLCLTEFKVNAQEFPGIITELPYLDNPDIIWGDLDKDNDLDIILSGYDWIDIGVFPGHTYAYLNNGNNTFSEIINPGIDPVYNSSLAMGDYDNDGYLDVLLSGIGINDVPVTHLYRNNGDLTFTKLENISLAGVSDGQSAFLDLDNDGRRDVLIYADAVFKIYRNTIEDGFIEVSSNIKSLEKGDVAWADYDNDNDLDILIKGLDNYTGDYLTILYRNNGEMIFEEQTDVDIEGLIDSHGRGVLEFIDYNSDGYADILISGIDPLGFKSTLIYRNSMNNSFLVDKSASSSLNYPDVSCVGDLDNDGFPDLLINTSYYRNNTDGTFADPVSYWTNHPQKLGVGDVDQDGDLDILFSDGSAFYHGFENDINNGNTSPSAPENTRTMLNFSQATLYWDKAQDNETPSTFLSYNIVVSRTKDGEEIMSPSSDLNFGGLRLPVLGNAFYGNSYTIKNLNPGTYYWKVQAVDNIYKGSTFSELDSFTILETFSLAHDFEEAFSTVSSLFGDYDNDGDYDILLSGSVLFRNDSNDQFIKVSETDFQDETGFPSWGDYDNDGDIDLLICGSPVKLFRNDGNESFQEYTNSGIGEIYGGFAAWGDYNNDGRLDFVITGATGPEQESDTVTLIYECNPDFTFTELKDSNPLSLFDSRAYWGDYDLDQDLDLLLTGITKMEELRTILYKNNGGEGFVELSDMAFNNTSGYRAIWEDMDYDGDLDILIPALGDQIDMFYYRLFLNEQNDTFIESAILRIMLDHACLVDFDNDGDLDLATYLRKDNYTTANRPIGIPSLYECKGSLNYKYTDYAYTSQYNSSWSDYDNDGDVDLVSAGMFRRNLMDPFGGGTLFPAAVIKNNAYTQNEQPGSPSGLSAVQTNDGISFVWNPAEDDHTPAVSLTYNLRVGTAPGGNDILSSMSDPVTGKMLLPKHGNCGMNTGWKLDSLPDDTYYWSVQAVDQNFIASDWSEESIFKVSNLLANFEADTVCVGSATSFTETSVSAAEAIDSWKWEFPDGSVKTDRQPSFTFNEAGSFDVTLVVASDSYADTITKTVEVKNKPRADFSVEAVCQGIPSEFLNTSNENGLQISTWRWDFGDETGSDQKEHVSHAYLIPSIYPAKLIVRAENGCADSITRNAIVGENPVSFISAGGNTEICEGDSVTLTGNYDPDFLYKWNLNQIPLTQADSSTLAAKISGTYTLTITNPLGNCKATSDPIDVDSRAAPVPPTIIINGNSTFCEGEQVLLSISDHPDYNYQWKSGTGTVGSNSHEYIPVSSGVHTVEVTNASGCTVTSANAVSITLNPSPEKPILNITGKLTICSGDEQFLSITNFNEANVYSWYKNGIASGNDSIQMLLEESAVYHVQTENSFQCKSISNETDVTVLDELSKPEVVFSEGASLICPGDPVTLTIRNPDELLSYQWKIDGIAISGEVNNNHAVSADGLYTVLVFAQGCKIESDPVEIKYKPALPKPEIIAEGPNVWYLAVSNDTASFYRWYYEGLLIEESKEYIYIANQQLGKYYVEISDNGDCFTASDVISIPENQVLGIQDIDPWENLKIYPNPTPGLFTLEMDNPIMGELIIDIFGETGARVINIKFQKELRHFKSQIDLSEQPAAIYLIGLMLNEYQTTRMLIVE